MEGDFDLKMVTGLICLVTGIFLFGYSISHSRDYQDVQVYLGLGMMMFGSFLVLASTGMLRKS